VERSDYRLSMIFYYRIEAPTVSSFILLPFHRICPYRFIVDNLHDQQDICGK